MLAALAILMASAPGTPQTPDDRLLEELVAVYPYSVGGTMTSTPGGEYLYAAEGGAVAVIDADPDDPLADQHYQQPIKRCPVGSLGVLPVQMRLDPDSADKPLFGYHDLLYIAGGRDGLWAMQGDADDKNAPNLAVRLDDAGTIGGPQDSRRWCNDLAFITLGSPGDETTYLLALFGAKNESHLRMYLLEDARAAAAGGFNSLEEFGYEIDAVSHTVFGRNTDPGAADYPASFAFGMDVDEVADFAYVAMGSHGLVRVRLKEDWPYPTPEWGPYFGDESGYAQTPSLYGINTALYEDLEYYLDGELVAEHPPLFLDVAVDLTDPNDRWVHAAADHLGVVGFSLETAWDGFIIDDPGPPPVKYFHQEGIGDSFGSKHFVNLVSGVPEHKCSTFARRVQVVASNGALIVTTLHGPALSTPRILTMSRTMSFDHRMLGGLPLEKPWCVGKAGHGFTIAYDLTTRPSWVSNQINAAAIAEVGRHLYAPPIQEAGSLAFFTGRHAVDRGLFPGEEMPEGNEHGLHRIEFSGWPPSAPPLTDYQELVRRGESRAGRWVYRAALNAANPELLATASNEAGLDADGPLVLDLTEADGARIVANFDSGESDAPPGVIDRRDGTNGIIFEPDATVAVGTEEYRFSMRRWLNPKTGKREIRWRLAKLYGGVNVTDPSTPNPPIELKEIFFTAPRDQFLSRGYYQYTGAGYSPQYNAERNVNFLFASLLDSPQGIRVLDFQLLIDEIDGTNTIDGKNYNLDASRWDTARIGELSTHPEFWLVDDCRETGYDPDAENFLDREGEFGGRVRTLAPQFIKLPKRGAGFPADTWVLVVPCAYAACHETAEVFVNHPEWVPQSPFWTGQGFKKLMVRFFNIDDPQKITEHNSLIPGQFGSPELPAYTLLGPDEGSAAWFLRTLHLDLGGPADDRYFCFVADLGGHLYVYEITNLLTIPPDFSSDAGIKSHIHYGATINWLPPFATYVPPDCPADDLTSNVWDVEVDQTSWIDDQDVTHEEVYVYVSVQREGVQVLRFDVDGTSDATRLVPLEMISTPGETSFLYLCEVPAALEAVDYDDYVTDRLLFVGDAIAGFRIYTYAFESQ